jgi:hypothetical protein
MSNREEHIEDALSWARTLGLEEFMRDPGGWLGLFVSGEEPDETLTDPEAVIVIERAAADLGADPPVSAGAFPAGWTPAGATEQGW